MLYTDLDSLMAIFGRIDIKDTRSMAALGVLVRVYNNAVTNPPDGVIGVGAITYAQDTLIDFQLDHPEAVEELRDAIAAWEDDQ